VDEPENFLALPEIQPWLDALHDHMEDRDLCQALLVSHHPKVINFLTSDAGIWISRKGENGPSRPQTVSEQGQDGGLSVAQLVERGWIYDA